MTHPRIVRRGSEPLSSLHMVQRVKQPQKVMVWGCMHAYGFGRMPIIEGTMNYQQYMNGFQTRLSTQANEWCCNDFIFQQDNAPCHTSKASEKYWVGASLAIKLSRYELHRDIMVHHQSKIAYSNSYKQMCTHKCNFKLLNLRKRDT